MFNDLRYAVRLLLHAKGWAIVIVLSLALGIGANTALFSAIDGLYLRTLIVDEPDTLVRFRSVGPNDMVTQSFGYGFSGQDPAGFDICATFSHQIFQEFLAAQRTLTDLFACAPLLSGVNVVVDGRADIASAFVSSGNYYRVLGVTAHLGRTIVPDDDRPAAAPVAVLSYQYWRSRFAGDPGSVGKVIHMNSVPVTVVGVLPPDFTGVQRAIERAPDVSVPLALDAQLRHGRPSLNEPTHWWLQIMGRLKPGVTPVQVEGNLGSVFQHTAKAGFDAHLASLPDEARLASYNRNRTDIPHLVVDSGSRGIYGAFPTEVRAGRILGVVVGLILLIVCANVANLLLSRATTRQQELAVRSSLGATRVRLIRQLLSESLLLAFIGGALGLLTGYWGQQLLPGGLGASGGLDWTGACSCLSWWSRP